MIHVNFFRLHFFKAEAFRGRGHQEMQNAPLFCVCLHPASVLRKSKKLFIFLEEFDTCWYWNSTDEYVPSHLKNQTLSFDGFKLKCLSASNIELLSPLSYLTFITFKQECNPLNVWRGKQFHLNSTLSMSTIDETVINVDKKFCWRHWSWYVVDNCQKLFLIDWGLLRIDDNAYISG